MKISCLSALDALNYQIGHKNMPDIYEIIILNSFYDIQVIHCKNESRTVTQNWSSILKNSPRATIELIKELGFNSLPFLILFPNIHAFKLFFDVHFII